MAKSPAELRPPESTGRSVVKSIVIHTILLAVALPVAYLTWTRDPYDDRTVPLWDEDADDIVSVTLKDRRKLLHIDRRSDDRAYLWGTRMLLQSADSTSSQTPALPDSVSFLVGELEGAQVMALLASPRAVRDLGSVAKTQAEYGFAGDAARVRIQFQDTVRELVIGAVVFGSGDRYVMAPPSDHVYVLSGVLLDPLMGADLTLTERRLHDYPPDRVASATVTTSHGTQTFVALEVTGRAIVWARSEAPDQPDDRVSDLMARIEESGISDFRADLDSAALTPLLRAEYLGKNGDVIGFLEFSKRSNDQGATDYFLRTELTRVVAQTYTEMADLLERDLDAWF